MLSIGVCVSGKWLATLVARFCGQVTGGGRIHLDLKEEAESCDGTGDDDVDVRY